MSNAQKEQIGKTKGSDSGYQPSQGPPSKVELCHTGNENEWDLTRDNRKVVTITGKIQWCERIRDALNATRGYGQTALRADALRHLNVAAGAMPGVFRKMMVIHFGEDEALWPFGDNAMVVLRNLETTLQKVGKGAARGVTVYSAALEQPTLEDVFIQITGKKLRD